MRHRRELEKKISHRPRYAALELSHHLYCGFCVCGPLPRRRHFNVVEAPVVRAPSHCPTVTRVRKLYVRLACVIVNYPNFMSGRRAASSPKLPKHCALSTDDDDVRQRTTTDDDARREAWRRRRTTTTSA